MAGRRDRAGGRAQLSGDTGDRAVEGFLEGLVGGLLLGAALVLIVARRRAVVADAPIQEISIELKGRATRLAQDAREGTDVLTSQIGALSGQTKAALGRLVPDDTRPEA